MGLIQTVGPTEEVFEVGEAKEHLRVSFSEDDTYIHSLIVAAREYCEKRQWKAYLTQTWRLDLDAFPYGRVIELNPTPVQSVSSVKYILEDDTEEEFDSANYFLDASSVPARLVLDADVSWPSDLLREANGVQVTFVAGYADAGAVPERMKHAMLMLIGHWHEHRELLVPGGVMPVPAGVEALLTMDQSQLFA